MCGIAINVKGLVCFVPSVHCVLLFNSKKWHGGHYLGFNVPIEFNTGQCHQVMML